MRGTVLGICVAVVLLGLLAATAAYAGSKPVVSGQMATPSLVASGGTTTVTASVSGATSCTLSSNKAVGGLPATFSCESGNVNREVTMPQNEGKKAVKYKLTLIAAGTGGSAKVKLTIDVGTPTAMSISADSSDTCALLTTRRVMCWGENNDGQVGSGKTTKPEGLPAQIPSIADANEVAVGGGHACALLATGHVECWGEERRGSLGNGISEGPKECAGGEDACSKVPVEVQGVSDAVQLGGNASCVLLSNGHVECWGENLNGQLGNGMSRSELEYSTVPVEVVGISNATQLAAHSQCVLLPTGHVECWGYNEQGQLGDEWVGHGNPMPSHSSDIPVEALGVTDAAQLNGSCALLTTGHLDCWGSNEYGQVGDDTDTGPDHCGLHAEIPCSTVPVEVSDVTQAIQVAQGSFHACGLLSSGQVECWGSNEDGQLGNGEHGAGKLSLAPVPVVEVTTAVQIEAGTAHACALLASGHIKCWGAGSSGQLGSHKVKANESFNTGTPVSVAGI